MFGQSPSSSRMWRFALILILVIAASAPITENVHADTRVINPVLPATFAWPTWWSGGLGTNDCDADVYNAYATGDPDASVMQTWRGIQACGPRPVDTGLTGVPFSIAKLVGTGNTPTQYMFQCTELVKRYLRTAYSADIITADGNQIAYNYATQYPTKFQYFVNDGSKSVYPQEGDVISMTSSDSAGHTAIVTELNISETAGNGYIMLMDQNGSPNGSFRLDIVDYVIQSETEQGLGYAPTDWIHPLVGIENSPSASVYTTITSIAAYDSNHAWVAGHDRTGGASFQTTTWNWNGSSWMKYTPASVGGIYWHNYLHSITVDTNGDVYTAGEYLTYYQGGYRFYTLIFKWDPTTQAWVRKTSDNYSLTSSNYLNAVADDTNGNIYAVGYGNNLPLLLKWNGTKFENQNLALPQGVTFGQLTDISFSSSSNGWIVGSIGSIANGEYVYHFDGSTWTPIQLAANKVLQKVVAVSDTEAWGVGYLSAGGYWLSHIFHYTSANGWEDVWGPSSYVQGQPVLYNIDADESDNVWVVGLKLNGSTNQPYMMKLINTTWTVIPAPTYSLYSELVDVSLSDGYVWAAGNSWLSSTPRYPRVLIK